MFSMDRLTKDEKKRIRHQEWEEKLKNEQKSQLYKKIGIWAGAIIIFGLVIWVLILATNNPTTEQTKKITTLPNPTTKDIAIGTSSAKVVITEYADFQCPACSVYYLIVKQIIQDFGDNVKYIYRNFPLDMHPNAKPSAYAAYSAFKQGKFTEMEDLLYTNQKDWSTSDNPGDIFKQYAQKIGLDMNKFNKDFASEETKKFVNDQGNEAIALGISSTPTFFVNKTQIQVSPNYEEFKKIIENEINKK
jgi:protein-disulfide isomerase